MVRPGRGRPIAPSGPLRRHPVALGATGVGVVPRGRCAVARGWAVGRLRVPRCCRRGLLGGRVRVGALAPAVLRPHPVAAATAAAGGPGRRRRRRVRRRCLWDRCAGGRQ